MISKTNKGYVVKSKSGKTLSRAYPTREQAQRRLAQIEMFKHINKSGK